MNISGIRTNAGFYDYNSIKINEVRNQQIQEAKEKEQSSVMTSPEQDTQKNESTDVITAVGKKDYGAEEFLSRYQPEASYELRGVDSDISKLDVEKALSDMRRDRVLQQYQFFVGDHPFDTTEAMNRSREKENFWL